jgi:hypothetical protein
VTELVSGLTAPRDLTFGPAGSDLEDELFVVHFEGAEATWIQSVDSGPVQQRFENSLVGAIAVDMDPGGRFYFACLTPVIGGSRGVITVRDFDGSVPDFQYAGIDEPSGGAVDAKGGLFVFNRGSRSVVRIDFADGAASNRHGVEIIAENLAVSDKILPSHLLVDGSGRLLIAETAADRVLIWAEEEIAVCWSNSTVQVLPCAPSTPNSAKIDCRPSLFAAMEQSSSSMTRVASAACTGSTSTRSRVQPAATRACCHHSPAVPFLAHQPLALFNRAVVLEPTNAWLMNEFGGSATVPKTAPKPSTSINGRYAPIRTLGPLWSIRAVLNAMGREALPHFERAMVVKH